MADIISFMKGSQLQALTSSDRLCYAIQPFIQEILNQFVILKDLGEAILRSAAKYEKVVAKLFDLQENDPINSFSLKEKFLFPDRNHWQLLNFSNGRFPDFLQKRGAMAMQDQNFVRELHNLLYLCGQSRFTYQEISNQTSDQMQPIFEAFLQSWILQQKEFMPLEVPTLESGVYRLQHAALLYRSQTTGILVDPHLHSSYGIPKLNTDISRAMLEGLVDGILISHSHYDHWHYPTLMQFSPDIPIIVPRVPRGSITCEDMAAQLREIGFINVYDVPWNSDPFYGEQVLVPEHSQPVHPDLKNWGNTYLIETDSYRSWFLIDAGIEPEYSILDVADEVYDRYGAIDWVVSNFQPLSYNSIGVDITSWGLDIVSNLLSNPPILGVTSQSQGEYTATLGPKGVAEVCAKVKAKACLPYADSWAELGKPTVHDQILIPQVQSYLRQLGCETIVHPWTIGNGLTLTGLKKGFASNLLQ
jgi:hypothetical protein